MIRARLAGWLSIGALVLAYAMPSDAQQRPTGELAPNEIRAALQASRAVFAAQAAERREAELAGLTELEGEFRSLRRAISDAAGTRKIERAEGTTPATAPPDSSDESTERIAKTQRELDSIQARTRGIEAKIEWLDSPRQRAVARAATAKLNVLRNEAEAALRAPDQAREQRLRDLADRLTVIRIDPARREKSQVPRPTLSVQPGRALIARGQRRNEQTK